MIKRPMKVLLMARAKLVTVMLKRKVMQLAMSWMRQRMKPFATKSRFPLLFSTGEARF